MFENNLPLEMNIDEPAMKNSSVTSINSYFL